ncbi:PEPxxWA-CTERM sorting domain-containing protein [Sandarakinorhabdus cyanobacteriorum]|uniref:PEPxxWA-CTERM sorting domain-containing protein n=1 Tax=Sandarakinorhabdus cyanobacteriorum TaxID=1981098 RepID=UPI0013FD6688|nr:PEPxxWA-CTERM sorting domain-containing protein [Sandarakinorhabdus cyanobacteriorum]
MIRFPNTSALTPYAVVSVGSTASFNQNSGPITGKLLVGQGSTVSSSGGGNGSITGGAYGDNQTQLNNLRGLQTDPTLNLVTASDTLAAYNQALALADFANALAATQTSAGAITGTRTLTNTGAVTITNPNGPATSLSVIDFTSLSNSTLTISGGANDFFVLRTSGNFSTNRTIALTGGVTADRILWVMNGTSGNIFQTSGGNNLIGTFLATKGGNFQFSAIQLTGKLINTAGHIQFVSNSTMTDGGLTVPVDPVPEPAAWTMLIGGFMLVGQMARRQQQAARVRAA